MTVDGTASPFDFFEYIFFFPTLELQLWAMGLLDDLHGVADFLGDLRCEIGVFGTTNPNRLLRVVFKAL